MPAVTRDEAELRAYLGDRFDLAALQDHRRRLAAEAAAINDEGTLYRTSEAYLYDLTAFAMTATKAPYHRAMLRCAPPGATFLDYGCGIGSDGLRLLEAGHRVAFADFDNPSVAYLRWRLRQRGLSAPIHDLDRDVPSGFDIAYAFDVIEHVDDPFAFLAAMEARARLVVVNFLEPDGHELHRRLPVRALVRHAARHRLAHYRVYHRRSHLVVYESATPGSLADRARVLAGRLPRFGRDRKPSPDRAV